MLTTSEVSSPKWASWLSGVASNGQHWPFHMVTRRHRGDWSQDSGLSDEHKNESKMDQLAVT